MSDGVETDRTDSDEQQLEAELLERREAALAHVVKFGDPVLKSKASPVTNFGPELRAEVERMISIMRDGMGVGLAATQLGVLRRLLVFQTGPDGEPTALANPAVEWLSGECSLAEEGCLSLPRVSMDVERPRGRGRKLASPPAAEAARELGIELLQAEDVNGEATRERIGAARPRAVVVCAFGQLVREPLLSEHAMLNVHPSLLPRWRGAAPIERAIMAGDRRPGVCVMELTAGLDSGPVALSAEVPIGADTDFEALSSTLAGLGGELLVRALNLAAEGKLEFEEQDEEQATYAEKS